MKDKQNISVGSRGAVVSAALSDRKVAGSIPTIGDFHTVGPCKKAVFACWATDVEQDTFTFTFTKFHEVINFSLKIHRSFFLLWLTNEKIKVVERKLRNVEHWLA